MLSHTSHFESYRSLLFAIAYRMLGSVMEAEEMVQETFLRWQQVDLKKVTNVKAYLSSIVTRLSIDRLRSAQAQREHYIGPWLPEPLLHEQAPDVSDTMLLADSLSMAFLTLLETLSPIERAVFLLHDIFDYEYTTVAQIAGRNATTCRQIARRARQRLTTQRPRFEATTAHHEALTHQFIQSCTNGDMESLLTLLAEDVVLYSDGGGKRIAARKPIHGATRVARFLLSIWRKAPDSLALHPTQINNQPALIAYIDRHPFSVHIVHIAEGQIQQMYNILNPDKLRHIPPLA